MSFQANFVPFNYCRAHAAHPFSSLLLSLLLLRPSLSPSPSLFLSRSCFTMQLLNLRVCELAAMRMPPVPVKLWRSKLAPGGIEHNESIERHFSRVGAQRQALT